MTPGVQGSSCIMSVRTSSDGAGSLIATVPRTTSPTATCAEADPLNAISKAAAAPPTAYIPQAAPPNASQPAANPPNATAPVVTVPKASSSVLTAKISLIFASFSSFGAVETSYHFDTVCRVTPRCTPSCYCNQPFDLRSSVSFSANFISYLPWISVITIPQFAPNVYQFPLEFCQQNLTSALLCGFY